MCLMGKTGSSLNCCLILSWLHEQMHEIAEGVEESSELDELDELEGDEEDEERVYREIEKEIFEDLGHGRKSIPRGFADKEDEAVLLFDLDEDGGATLGISHTSSHDQPIPPHAWMLSLPFACMPMSPHHLHHDSPSP
jgi:hypothetical protein